MLSKRVRHMKLSAGLATVLVGLNATGAKQLEWLPSPLIDGTRMASSATLKGSSADEACVSHVRLREHAERVRCIAMRDVAGGRSR